MDDEFKIRLGRLRDKPAPQELSFQKRFRNIANRSKYKNGYQTRYARGQLAALETIPSLQKGNDIFRRRVMIKVHLAKPSKTVGRAGFSIHLKYLQREGVEKNGSGGELYSADGVNVDERKFIARSEKDRHQFRFIVSAEDSHALKDLKPTIRQLMRQVEHDVGSKLDWVAVDHFNTDHPHTHIVMRGKDKSGCDLVIARDYLTQGMRIRAEDIIIKELGLRSDHEIFATKRLEVTKDRFTSLDRDIENHVRDGSIKKLFEGPLRIKFEASFLQQRLEYLQSQDLANFSNGEWQLKPAWQDVMKARGKRGDIIRSLANQHDRIGAAEDINLVEERKGNWSPLLGIVVNHGVEDELQDHRFLIIEDQQAKRWHVSLGQLEYGIHPPLGAVVEVERVSTNSKPSDVMIDQIAKHNNGTYSDLLHREYDLGASPAFRLALKRRLEGLRRKNIVALIEKDVWKIPTNYLTRVTKLVSKDIGQANLSVKSWLPLEDQITAHGVTWLDRQKDGLVGRLLQAKEERNTFLRQNEWLKASETELSATSQELLRSKEFKRVQSIESKASKRLPLDRASGYLFTGRYEKSLFLGQGRMAVIGNSHQFAIVPWRQALERYRGRDMQFEMGRSNLSWRIGKERDLGR